MRGGGKNMICFYASPPQNFKKNLGRFLMASFIIFLAGCSARTTVQPLRPIVRIEKNSINILKPVLRFEDLKKEKRSYSDEINYSRLERGLLRLTKSNLAQKGFSVEVVDQEISYSEEKSDLTESEDLFKLELSKGYVSSKAKPYLQQKCQNPNKMLLALAIKIYKGESGAWFPNTGTILPNTHKSCIYAALIDCSSHKTIWKNAIILREIPDDEDDEDFIKAVTRLFADFPTPL